MSYLKKNKRRKLPLPCYCLFFIWYKKETTNWLLLVFLHLLEIFTLLSQSQITRYRVFSVGYARSFHTKRGLHVYSEWVICTFSIQSTAKHANIWTFFFHNINFYGEKLMGTRFFFKFKFKLFLKFHLTIFFYIIWWKKSNLTTLVTQIN
jgi:hypothetical protein